MREVVFCYMAAINLFGFWLCLHDKNAAVRGKWRVTEKNLFLAALLGGGAGVMISMLLFRHKTKRLKFMVGMPLVIVLNVYLFTRLLQISG